MKTAVASLLLALALASGTPEQATALPALADPRVGALLDALNLTHYAAHFANHEVDYETLLGLTDAELKEVGVKALGARKRILNKAIDAFGTEKKQVPKASVGTFDLPYVFTYQIPVGGSVVSVQCGQLTDINGDGAPDFVVACGSGITGTDVNPFHGVYLNSGTSFCIASENDNLAKDRAYQGFTTLPRCAGDRVWSS